MKYNKFLVAGSMVAGFSCGVPAGKMMDDNCKNNDYKEKTIFFYYINDKGVINIGKEVFSGLKNPKNPFNLSDKDAFYVRTRHGSAFYASEEKEAKIDECVKFEGYKIGK